MLDGSGGGGDGGSTLTADPPALRGGSPKTAPTSINAVFLRRFMYWPTGTNVATKLPAPTSLVSDPKKGTVVAASFLELAAVVILAVSTHNQYSLQIILTSVEIFKRYLEMQRNASIKQIPADLWENMGNCFNHICEGFTRDHNL